MPAREGRLATVILAILQQIEMMQLACPNEPQMLNLRLVLLKALEECYVVRSPEACNALEVFASCSRLKQRRPASGTQAQ